MIIKVNGESVQGFTRYSIDLRFNAVASSFSFMAKQDVLDYILEYPVCEIIDEKQGLLLTGRILAPDLKSSPAPELTQLSGYSKTGVLEDCTVPLELYPLQTDNLSLAQITDKLLAPFDLDYTFSTFARYEMDLPYKKVTAKPEEKIKQYLNKLASERGLILSNNEKGELLYSKLSAEFIEPVEVFEVGRFGVKTMRLRTNAQAMHSEITIMRQASSDNPDAGEFVIQNPYVKAYRPITKISNSGDLFNAERAARYELSNEISNIKLSFDTTKFVKPGSLIKVRNPEIRINKFTDFFVESCVISGSEKDNEKYTLTCVLKDVYTTDEVKNVFE